jgi:hypothetical protein
LEKVIQNDTVYIIKKLLTLERNSDPVPKNFMFLSEMLTEKDFLNEIRKFVSRIVKIIPVDQDDTDNKYFVVAYPRGLLKQPISKIYLELICNAITKGIRNEKQYQNAKIIFITDFEAFRQCYKEILLKKRKSEIIANSPPGSTVSLDMESFSKKYSKSLVLMDEKNSSIITGVDNKDFEKTYEKILDIDDIFNALNDIDVETYKTLYIDFGLKEIRFHYSEFINIIKPIKNMIVDDLTDILIEQHLSNFCYNLTSEKQRRLRNQLRADVRNIILPKFTDDTVETYQHEFKFEMLHFLKVTKEMINSYIESSLLYDVIERIQENVSTPLYNVELVGGLCNLYYHYIKKNFPELKINISNINISVGCVYYEQQLLEKEKLVRNKYRDAKIDCKNQIEKLNASLDEERMALSFINKEQLDFFHRQQEKQQQLIERNTNKPNSEFGWMGNVHKKDAKEQEQSFVALIEKKNAVEERIENIRQKIKKVEEFRDGLDKYYQSVVTSFGNVSFDFFSSYSIVISSNEETLTPLSSSPQPSNNNLSVVAKKADILNELNLSPESNNNLYFKKLGLTLDDTTTEDHQRNRKIEVVGSFTDINKSPLKDRVERTSTPLNNNSNVNSVSSSPTSSIDDNDNGMTFQMDMEKPPQKSSSRPIPGRSYHTRDRGGEEEKERMSINNIYNSSIYSTSQSSLSTTPNGSYRNAFAALNNKFISFNLQSDRLKRKTQLLEENRSLGSELKKVQTKNFTINEEMAHVKQENQELKSENERLQQQIEELTKKLQALEKS